MYTKTLMKLRVPKKNFSSTVPKDHVLIDENQPESFFRFALVGDRHSKITTEYSRELKKHIDIIQESRSFISKGKTMAWEEFVNEHES